MGHSKKDDLKQQVIMGVADYGVGYVLFRHAVAEALGFNATDMECLTVLFLKGTASPSELSRHTSLSSGATTAMLDRLEKSGLIERQPNPRDRRGTLIRPAKDAAARVLPLFASVRQAQDEIVLSYSEPELAIIADFLKRFVVMWEDEHKKLIETRHNEGFTK
jgi:DNA-binding MarR family transcriptional regulator